MKKPTIERPNWDWPVRNRSEIVARMAPTPAQFTLRALGKGRIVRDADTQDTPPRGPIIK